MTIKEAMQSYFVKLEHLYRQTFGTLPTVSWDKTMDQALFVGKPDKDDEIQWKPKAAEKLSLTGLSKELADFFGAYYYWQLRGKYKKTLFDFPASVSLKEAEKTARAALSDGEYYFPGQKTALLASCGNNGNDDLLLFYRQNTGELFLYDKDKRFVYPMDCSLTELIHSLEAVI